MPSGETGYGASGVNLVGHFDMGEPAANRTRQAVEQATPTKFFLNGLSLLWPKHVPNHGASFVRTLPESLSADLRRDNRGQTRATFFSIGGMPQGAEKIPKPRDQRRINRRGSSFPG